MKIVKSAKCSPITLGILDMFIDRSKQKWREGARTDPKLGKQYADHFKLKGEFLVSSYSGALVTTVTTAKEMQVFLTEELPDSVRKPLEDNHRKNSSLVGYEWKAGDA